MAKAEGGLPIARIQTNRGTIVLELFQKDAPKTVDNFVKLARTGYYDGQHWHRVISNFMIQGGDPFSKQKPDPKKGIYANPRVGTGGPGYTFADETRGNPRRHGIGSLSMANAGPNTNGSQFFITHVATPHLDGKHTVFGHVLEGQDVVNAVREWDEIQKVTIEGA